MTFEMDCPCQKTPFVSQENDFFVWFNNTPNRAGFLPQTHFRKENEKICSDKKNGGQTKSIAVSAVIFTLPPLFFRTR